MKEHGVAFVGCYLPRTCGIATFTYDLAEAAARSPEYRRPVEVVAVNALRQRHTYPRRVTYQIDQDDERAYRRAADYLNESGATVVSLQHEYGIYGGEYGSAVLTLLQNLRLPVAVTCHTIKKNPNPVQREIIQEMAARADRLVVMSRLGIEFMRKIYGVPGSKLVYIPHGIHNVPLREPGLHKKGFGVSGRVLLTFGLLHRKKGIEFMIEAFPEICTQHPGTLYIIMGITHPAVAASEGESYRRELEGRVRRLGLRRSILFYPRFVTLHDLLRFLSETDIFVTPYLDLEYITSGALAYAMGCGTPVVSTPYWYAREMLDNRRGVLVPMRDAHALSREINRLLGDEQALREMRTQAYSYCRGMLWPLVARSYMKLFSQLSQLSSKPTAGVLKTASISNPRSVGRG